MKPRARLLAFYLPQYHPIPENDLWWGKGFTEWTNVAKARPLFRGHLQPKLPADLGFYDLRVAEIREEQALMAKAHGVEGFCYWHYWFGGGRRLLERPFDSVLQSGSPDFPFCLAWANESWTGIWHGAPGKILIEQQYLGESDCVDHFYALLPAFRDHRYLRVHGKSVFVIYRPKGIPDCKVFTDTWRRLSSHEGVPDFHFIGAGGPFTDMPGLGLDAWITDAPKRQVDLYLNQVGLVERARMFMSSLKRLSLKKTPFVCDYRKVAAHFNYANLDQKEYPLVMPNWDNTPRSGVNGYVLENSRPEYFENQLRYATNSTQNRDFDERLIFLKSWNEWAEGNYVEPCVLNGNKYLLAIRRALTD